MSAMGLVLPVYLLGAVILVLRQPATWMLSLPVLFLLLAWVLPKSAATAHDWAGWLVTLLAAGLLFLFSKPKSRRQSPPVAEQEYPISPVEPEKGESAMQLDPSTLLGNHSDQMHRVRNEEQSRAAFEKAIPAQRRLERAATEVKELERALANAHEGISQARQSFIDARSELMGFLGGRAARGKVGRAEAVGSGGSAGTVGARQTGGTRRR